MNTDVVSSEEKCDFLQRFEEFLKISEIVSIDVTVLDEKKTKLMREINKNNSIPCRINRILEPLALLSVGVFLASLFFIMVIGTLFALCSWMNPSLASEYAENVSLGLLIVIVLSIFLLYIFYNLNDYFKSKIKPTHWNYQLVENIAVGTIPQHFKKIIAQVSDFETACNEKVELCIERTQERDVMVLSARVIKLQPTSARMGLFRKERGSTYYLSMHNF